VKKRLMLGAAVLISSMLVFAGCSRNGGNEESSSGVKVSEDKFVVGLDDNFPPMGFRDESGEIVGFDIDLAKATAEEMGMEVEFKSVDWDGVLLSLKKGDIDVIWNGLTVTEERKEEINFTDTYLANRQVLIVKDDSEVESKSDLEGKVLGLQLGSSSEKALESDEEFNDSISEVTKYANNTEALMDLSAGRVDAVLVDEIVGRYYMSKREGEFRVLSESLGEEDYAVGVRKEDEEFLEKLNDALNTVKNSETGKEISNEWFDEDILVK
jgi:polar amino acid transport system substrate-binding protein